MKDLTSPDVLTLMAQFVLLYIGREGGGSIVSSLGEQPTLSLSAKSCRKSGLDMSAAQRFVYTLRVIGLISRDGTRRYRLTPKLLHFGYSYLKSSDLVNRCSPHLLELNNRSSETTNLTVLDGTEIVFVMRLLSRHVANFDAIVE